MAGEGALSTTKVAQKASCFSCLSAGSPKRSSFDELVAADGEPKTVSEKPSAVESVVMSDAFAGKSSAATSDLGMDSPKAPNVGCFSFLKPAEPQTSLDSPQVELGGEPCYATPPLAQVTLPSSIAEADKPVASSVLAGVAVEPAEGLDSSQVELGGEPCYASPPEAEVTLASPQNSLPTSPQAPAEEDTATFLVVIPHSAGSMYGVKCEPVEDGALIHSVFTAGLFADWNVAHPERQVQAGDAIIEVEGVSHGVKTIEEMAKLGNFQFRILKAMSKCDEAFVVDLPREVFAVVDHSSGQKLGVRLKPNDTGLLISGILEGGLLHEYNLKQLDELRFTAGDSIVEVSGVSAQGAGGAVLLDELSKNQELRIRFCKGEVQ